jgi:hypothetical protein
VVQVDRLAVHLHHCGGINRLTFDNVHAHHYIRMYIFLKGNCIARHHCAIRKKPKRTIQSIIEMRCFHKATNLLNIAITCHHAILAFESGRSTALDSVPLLPALSMVVIRQIALCGPEYLLRQGSVLSRANTIFAYLAI